MSEAIYLSSKSMSLTRVYSELLTEFEAIASGGVPWESALVSLIALLKERLPYVSWIGFYRAHEKELWVGPYQGKLACLKIPFGKGVCGRAYEENRAFLVADVEAFEGHIACDALSRSEIVLPVLKNGTRLGVLDLDSYQVSAFDEVDRQGLEKLLVVLSRCAQ